MSGTAATSGSKRKRHALSLFEGLPQRYDRVGAVLSFGQDPRWRHAMVEAVAARPGDRVLDVATGTGLVSEALVRRYGCTVVGLDQSTAMLEAARARLARDTELGGRVSLVVGEAEHLPFADAEFDHLTFTYLLRYVDDPAATLRELWTLYTRVGLPALGRLVSREWRETGSFLARSIPEFYARHPLEEVLRLWSDAGIGGVRVRRMSLGCGVVIWGTRTGGRAESS